MRSLFHNGATYLTGMVIFFACLDLEQKLNKNPHFWMDSLLEMKSKQEDVGSPKELAFAGK